MAEAQTCLQGMPRQQYEQSRINQAPVEEFC